MVKFLGDNGKKIYLKKAKTFGSQKFPVPFKMIRKDESSIT